jgi:hypothetical protein
MYLIPCTGDAGAVSDVYAVDDMRSKKKVPKRLINAAGEERFPVHIDTRISEANQRSHVHDPGGPIAFGLKNITILQYFFPDSGRKRSVFRICGTPENELLMYVSARWRRQDFGKLLTCPARSTSAS